MDLFKKLHNIAPQIVSNYIKDEQKVHQELERLKPYIDEFKDLAIIENYSEIRFDHETCRRLMEAFEIMKETKYPPWRKCSPCEVYGLCAIKALTNSETKAYYGKKQAIYKGDLIEITGGRWNDGELVEYYAHKPNFDFDENQPKSSENPMYINMEIRDIENVELIELDSTKEFYEEKE